jgi:N-acetyl-gamma-glutamyl-phosphate reductase
MVHVNARVVCGRAVIVAAVDNLTKGAAGQAVQNANVMFGLGEGEGLQGACERTPAGRRA